jgi:hypothetical protein
MNDLAPRLVRPTPVAQRCACGGNHTTPTGAERTTGTLQRLFDESPKVQSQRSVQRMFDPDLEDELSAQRMAADTTTVDLEDLLEES